MADEPSVINAKGPAPVAIAVDYDQALETFKASLAALNASMVALRNAPAPVKELASSWGARNSIWNGVDWDWEFPQTDEGLYHAAGDNDWSTYAALVREYRRSRSGLSPAAEVKPEDIGTITPPKLKLARESLKTLNLQAGSIITGVIVDIDYQARWVTVHAGLKSQALIPLEQFYNDAGDLNINVGNEVHISMDSDG